MITLCLFCSCDANIAKPGIDSGMRLINVPVNDICVDRRKLVYSLARILGLPDEHTRPDRDKFLTIHWDNISSNEFIHIHILFKISMITFKNSNSFVFHRTNYCECDSNQR